jgi:hypothetical protein
MKNFDRVITVFIIICIISLFCLAEYSYSNELKTGKSDGGQIVRANLHKSSIYAPPVAILSIIPDTMILGDSILADASASYDPDGDSLIFEWSVTSPTIGQSYGFWVFNTYFENNSKAFFTPTGTGDFSVKVRVSDGVLEDSTTEFFHVKPKTENISTIYSFVDTSWFRVNTFGFHEDKLLIPIQPLDSVRVYQLGENEIFTYTDLNISNAVRFYGIRDNLLFTGQQGVSGYWGPGPVSIHSLGVNWQIAPLLVEYLPGSSDIYSLDFIEDYLLIGDQNTLYNIDIQTNPAAPQIMASRIYTSGRPFSPQEASNYIYTGVWDFGRKIEILQKNTLSFIDSLDIPTGWRNFNVFDNLMFLGFLDSLQIYSLTDPLHPTKVASVLAPTPFDWMNKPPLTYDIIYYGRIIHSNVLALEGYGSGIGITFYDISDPHNPVETGSWYNGKGATIREHDGDFYTMGPDVIGNYIKKDQYYGFSKLDLGFLTDIKSIEKSKLSQNHWLLQNYPNPFNNITRIRINVPKTSKITLNIYNILGEEVATFISDKLYAGSYSYDWDASNFASGVYIYQLEAEGYVQTKKMILIK